MLRTTDRAKRVNRVFGMSSPCGHYRRAAKKVPMTRTGFYPGSFDPVTFGHLDIARRAVKLVDRLVVAVGTHHNKHALFSAEERLAMVVDALRPVADETGAEFDVTTFDTLTVAAARQVGATSHPRPARRHRLRLRDADGRHERAPWRRTLRRCFWPPRRNAATSPPACPPDRRHGRRHHRLRPGPSGRSLEEEIFRMMLTRVLAVAAVLIAAPVPRHA